MFASVVILRAIADQLGDAELAERIGIPHERLTDPLHRISYIELAGIVERAMSVSGDPGLGLTIGMGAPLTMLHLLHYLLVSCRTLRDAWAVFQRYAPLIAEGMSWKLHEHDDGVQLVHTHACASEDGARFTAEMSFALVMRLVAQNDPRCVPVRMLWRHKEPSYSVRYRSIFKCPQDFAQATNTLVMPRDCLDEVLPFADERLRAALESVAVKALRTVVRSSSTATRVRIVLRTTADLNEVTMTSVARELGLRRSALGRKLAAESASMRDLLDEVRCERACQYLRSGVEIAEIAEDVGFSETSAFHRAFKRWTGLTPASFRDGRPV